MVLVVHLRHHVNHELNRTINRTTRLTPLITMFHLRKNVFALIRIKRRPSLRRYSQHPSFNNGTFKFEEIRERRQFYVDKTRFIPQLEILGNNLLFLRPPLWGKSLFSTTLSAFYDCAVPKKQFNTLFAGLDVIPQVKETGARKYFVLKWVRFLLSSL